MGIDENWLDEGVKIGNFPTYYGTIGYTMVSSGKNVTVEFAGGADPPNGYILKSPYTDRDITSVELDGKRYSNFKGTEIYLKELPGKLMIKFKR